jgi:predicted transcriptional regulator
MTDLDQFIDLIRYSPMLEALCEEDLDRKELEQRLEISRATSHRRTKALIEWDLIEKTEGTFALTELGTTMTEVVTEFKRGTQTASVLAPVLEAIPDNAPDIDIADFTDAIVTTAGPGDPYRGVNRFMSLVRETDTLRGLAPSMIDPRHVDEFYARICKGLTTSAVFPPEVIENLFDPNPEQANEIFESGNLTLRTHTDMPFGLTLCDERIGISIYDTETGLLRTYIDTDTQGAYEWAEDFYAFYWAAADPLNCLDDYTNGSDKREDNFLDMEHGR